MANKTTTFEDFCKKYNVEAVLPVVTGVSEEVQKQMIATYKWEFIVKTLNNHEQEKEFVPDYKDRTQIKWELYIYYDEVSGWSLLGVDLWYTGTICGARRVFRTRELALLAFNEYLQFYIDTF